MRRRRANQLSKSRLDSSYPPSGGNHMVGKVTEITATSKKGFEDAIASGLARANKTIRNIKSAWVKEQTVRVDKGKIVEFQVNMLVTFVLDD